MYSKDDYEKHKKYRKEYYKKYYRKHKDEYKQDRVYRRKYEKQYKDRIKLKVFTHYGLKCKCCGESVFEFLSIDHINNDGNEQELNGHRFYLWIIKHKYPKDLQTLCMNCNWGKRLTGKCPHKT